MIYNKLPLTIDKQIDRLIERGLIIKNREFAEKWLMNVSYYRLAGYWWSMQSDKTNHIFKDNSNFEDVVSLYDFDKELRSILFDVIEKIEISIRTKLIYHLSLEHTPWWFTNADLFDDTMAYVKTLSKLQEECERSKDVFITEHKKMYKEDKRFPPSWKTLELTSLGGLSKLYGNLKSSVKSKDIIAKELGAVNHIYLPSWLQSITIVRNYCAHHSRLWNKNIPSRPKLLSNPPDKWVNHTFKEHELQNIYVQICIMKYLLNRIETENNISILLKNLFEKYPSVDLKALGFTENWIEEPIWK